MVMAIGVSAPMAAFYHLYTHAFFKAALFLAAGSIIHVLHTQDIRQMGGLRKIMPVTFIVYSVASAALIGIPFFSGFFSKESILNETWHWAQMHGQYYLIVPFFAFSSVIMTAFYVFRHFSLVFFGSSKTEVNVAKQRLVVDLPLILLGIGSVYIFPLYHTSHSYAYMPWVTVLLIGLGITMAYLICYRKYIKPFSEGHIIYRLSNNALYLDKIYEWVFIKPIHYLLNKLQPVDYKFDKDIVHGMGNVVIYFSQFIQFFETKILDAIVNSIATIGLQLSYLVSWFDEFIVDGIVNGIALLSRRIGDFIRAFQTGKVQSYFAMSALLLIFFIWYFIKDL
jgi:NADH-quinone oxidoreductase subunit L